jgi:hypothetical protein
MPSCSLNWYPDRGFELDLDTGDDEVTLRMVAVPVPADGTEILYAEGVDLHKLEILFKGQAEIQGEPGQIQDAHVRLVEQGELEIEVKIEDMETGDLVNWSASVPVQIAPGAPDKGGPKPIPPDEDELDWDDETTLERLIVDAPPASPTPDRKGPPKEQKGAVGIQRLLKALETLDEDSSDDEDDLPPRKPAANGSKSSKAPSSVPVRAAPTVPPSPPPASAAKSKGSSADLEEATNFIDLLIEREALALEEDATPADLAAGVAKILGGPLGPERKAKALSTWLMDQPAVADLYVDDDDLATILDQW